MAAARAAAATGEAAREVAQAAAKAGEETAEEAKAEAEKVLVARMAALAATAAELCRIHGHLTMRKR
jgi:hypothetical protein